jgi:beta-phosphoglucomutase-like phosphatase (HAD superfamily)
VSAEDIDDPGKPAPHIYEHAAGELGVAPSEVSSSRTHTDRCNRLPVIADPVQTMTDNRLQRSVSQNGIEAAVSSGAYTIGYRSTHNANLDLSRADIVVDGPSELASLSG